MCNKIDERITCEYCEYPASESMLDIDHDIPCDQEVLIHNTVVLIETLHGELSEQAEYDGHLDEDIAEIIHLLNGGTNG